MMQVTLSVSGLSRVFNRRRIFSGLDLRLGSDDSLAVRGRNGSGKSTLLKILAGVLSPSGGTVALSVGSDDVPAGLRYRYTGFVAPYLQLYDEFTAMENLRFFRSVRGLAGDDRFLLDLLGRFGLQKRENDPLRTFSSGMKQRVKYAFALLHDPPVLLLDEPTSNLDASGINEVFRLIEERKPGRIVVIATNNREESTLCNRTLDLDSRSPDAS
jgi:heme exporter protein A